ncbi:MAG: MATE family efflux transporter [Lachnospiraceae bacterium]|nr:MATE family efflux transporter [Lachnospiraceae bacterium]
MSQDEIAAGENKMGIMSVNRLLLTMSLPMMASMLVQALYNIVDSIFVSRISENALTAVSLAFPIQSVMIAMGAGMGVGVNAILSRSLGEKDYNSVNRSALNGIFLSLVNYIIFVFVGIFAVRPFYMSQTSDPEIIGYGTDYLTLVCCLSFGVYFQFIFERLLQSTGRTFATMITQTMGAVINIILDPIFIFGLLGMPAMGVKGAALATVIGQIVAATFAFILNLRINTDIRLRFSGFRPDPDIIKKIYSVGLPSIIMQSIGSIMVYGLNKILIAFSSTATAVFGVYFKLQSFVFLPVFGLNNGMVPILAYNYGARRRDRMTGTIKYAIIYAFIIMSAGTAVFWIFADKLLILFAASDHMMSMGIPALRIISIHFPIASFCIIIGSVFQALGRAVYSMINSIMRQVVVLLPVAYLLSLTGNVNNVWWSFPIAEIMSFTVTTLFLLKINREIISKV